MPPCEPVFQGIESGRDGENLEKVSVKLLYTVRALRNPDST